MRCKHIWHGDWVCGICKRDNIIEDLRQQNEEMKKTLTKIINCYDLRQDLYSNDDVALAIITDYARVGLRSVS